MCSVIHHDTCSTLTLNLLLNFYFIYFFFHLNLRLWSRDITEILPQTFQHMQTLLLKCTQQHTEEHQTHSRLHVAVTQTHARGTAVIQTWHVWFPRMLVFHLTLLSLFRSLILSLLFFVCCLFVFCLRRIVQRAKEEKEKARKGQMRQSRKKKKTEEKREKRGNETGLCNSDAFCFFYFWAASWVCLSVCVCACDVISIFKPLHRGWLLDSLPIGPTDCTCAH